jgi:hypothetical protein
MNEKLPLALRNHLQSEPTRIPLPPVIDVEVVQWLEKAWPSTDIPIDATLAEVQRYAGRRDVVQYLRAVYDQQE